MSQRSLRGAGRLRWAVPMVARDPSEPERAATPLELFFDLVFIVAVARAVESLHGGLIDGNVAGSVLSFFMVFFALWWAWMNFTWFASAYDCDDIAYRVSMFVAMTGALILAAGLPRAFEQRDLGLTVSGYVVMRLVLVTLWLRVSRSDAPRRTTARRFAFGVAACQAGWVAAAVALSPDMWILVAIPLAVVELLVPVWAESAGATPWHPGHIVERYGLFTIIVLGESVLAASFAIQSAVTDRRLTAELLAIIVGGLLILFSMWWLYFDRPGDGLMASTRGTFVWAYGHLVIFGSIAAMGSGLAVAVDGATGHSELGRVATGASVALPVVLFLLSMWVLYARIHESLVRKLAGLLIAVLVLAASVLPSPVLWVGLLLTVLVSVKVTLRLRRESVLDGMGMTESKEGKP